MSDALLKGLEFAAKYSWGVLVVASAVLFLPDSAITSMGLVEIRSGNLGIWWLLFIFSLALWSSSLLVVIKGWLKRNAKVRERFRVLEERIKALDEAEKEWIRFCLYFTVQTAPAYRANAVAQSLVNKGILREGSGHVLNLPFHFTDDAWLITQANWHEFLSPEEMNDPAVGERLEQFMQEVRRP